MADRTLTFRNKTSTDADRRKRSIDRMVRIVMVHRKCTGLLRDLGKTQQAKEIAKQLGVSSRTVFRDMQVLEKVYDQLGNTLLDHT